MITAISLLTLAACSVGNLYLAARAFKHSIDSSNRMIKIREMEIEKLVRDAYQKGRWESGNL